MPRTRDLILRTALSGLTMGAFFLLLSATPSARGERFPQLVAPPPHSPEPQASGSSSGVFSFNGARMFAEEATVPACDARLWNPLTAGYCAGRCTPLAEHRTAQGATFAWRDEVTDGIHSLTLSCPVPGAVGQASYFSFAGANWAAPAAGPRLPRTTPVPGLPGATEVFHFDSAGLSIFVDRPPSASTALEELQLALSPLGWRVAGGPALRLPADTPPSRAFVRGAEVYVATLNAPDDDSPPLLISAYSRNGWASEVAR